MADLAFKVEIDTSELDAAISKAERLKKTLEEVKFLQTIASGARMPMSHTPQVEAMPTTPQVPPLSDKD